MSDIVNMADGGIVLLLLGKGVEAPKDYAQHPRVLVKTSEEIGESMEGVKDLIPSTARIVVIGGDLPHVPYGHLKTVLMRRNLPYAQRRNETALLETLRKLLPDRPLNQPTLSTPTNGSGADAAKKPKGTVQDLIAKEVNLSKSNAEEARRLLRIATERGIDTTLGSLAQGIDVYRRKHGGTGTPLSVMSEQQKATQTLVDAIAGLQLILGYVEQVEAENLKLRTQVAKLKAAFED